MSDSRNQLFHQDLTADAEEKEFYRKVLEWKISEREEEVEEDSAYNSSGRSPFQSILSSSSLSQNTEIRKGKIPALQLVPGQKYNCSISSVFSPTSFLLRRNDEEFFKLTRFGASCDLKAKRFFGWHTWANCRLFREHFVLFGFELLFLQNIEIL